MLLSAHILLALRIARYAATTNKALTTDLLCVFKLKKNCGMRDKIKAVFRKRG
jgi:hypothetical protein